MVKQTDRTKGETDPAEAEPDQPGNATAAKPWTIKHVSLEARSAATRAAEVAGQQLGPWLSRAIVVAIAADRKASRAPTTTKKREARLPPDRAALAEDIEMVAKLSAAAGEPPPSDVTKALYSAIKRSVRGGRASSASGPTTAEPGATGSVASPTREDAG